jgi:hypothetical protein
MAQTESEKTGKGNGKMMAEDKLDNYFHTITRRVHYKKVTVDTDYIDVTEWIPYLKIKESGLGRLTLNYGTEYTPGANTARIWYMYVFIGKKLLRNKNFCHGITELFLAHKVPYIKYNVETKLK